MFGAVSVKSLITIVEMRADSLFGIGTHQGAVQEEHIQAYLDEYVFRFNRRTAAKRGLLFYRLLENAMQTSPTTYKDLINHDF